MSINADNPISHEPFSQQPVKVDLNLPVSTLFPQLPNITGIAEVDLQRVLDTRLKNVAALTNKVGDGWQLEFRSNDRGNRVIAKLPTGYYAFLADVNKNDVYGILNNIYYEQGLESQAFFYDTVLDNAHDFSEPGELGTYISALSDMLTSDGVLAVQLSDKSDPAYNQKVLAALMMRFNKPQVRPFEVVGEYGYKGAVYVFQKGGDKFATPTDETNTETGVPGAKEAVDWVEGFLQGQRDRRLVAVGSS